MDGDVMNALLFKVSRLRSGVAALMALSATSCSVLDLTDQKVSERVEMHAGSRWYVEAEDKQAEPTVPLSEETECTLNRQRPPAGISPNVSTAKRVHLYDRDVSLSPEGLQIGDDDKVTLYLINQGLNCAPPGIDAGGGWVCGEETSEPIETQEHSVLQRCLARKPDSIIRTTNYLGLIEDRYCLYVSLVEEKADKHIGKHWATDISRDQLKFELRCVDPVGEGGPKVIVGGPRPNYRKPGVTLTTAEPSAR